MNYLIALFSAMCVGQVLSQGFVPQFRPVPQPLVSRRQLTPVQQSQILNDVQQHQHRFNLHQNRQFDQNGKTHFSGRPHTDVFIEQSIQLPHSPQPNNLNQRPPPFNNVVQPLQSSQRIQFNNPIQQNQNNFRITTSQSQNSPVLSNDLHFQHHTQTNFVPNFVQQQQIKPVQQQANILTSQQSQQQQSFNRIDQQQISPIHQTQQPSFHQQPLHQRSLQNEFIQPNNPFQASESFAPTSSNQLVHQQFLPTPNAPQQNFAQNFATQQQPKTLQSQLLLNSQQNSNQFPTNNQQDYSPQILNIQPSHQIPTNQFVPSREQVDFIQQPLGNQQPFLPSIVLPLQQQDQQPQQQPQPQPQQSDIRDPKTEEEHLRELAEKQKIIQKHEQFVQKQYQKQVSKVKQLHDDFILKQRKIKQQSAITQARPPSTLNYHPKQQHHSTQSRGVFPYEHSTFQRAIKLYHEAHPTIAPPTTTTVTTTLPANSSIRPSKSGRSRSKTDAELESFIHSNRHKLLGQLKHENSRPKPTKSKLKAIKSSKPLGRDDLLAQLRLALADVPQDDDKPTDLILPGGQKVQVIRTSDPSLIQGATPINGQNSFLQQISSANSKSSLSAKKEVVKQEDSPVSYDQLTKSGILPPGADFEVVKQGSDGDLQSVGAIPPQKKITFVYLEEQEDGSFKVQGVKANGDKETKTEGEEVDSIVNRIKNGEIQLPPPSLKNKDISTTIYTTVSPLPPSLSPTQKPYSSVSVIPLSTQYQSISSPTTQRATISNATPISSIHFGSSVSSPSPYSTLASISEDTPIRLSVAPSSHFPSSTPSTNIYSTTYSTSPKPTILSTLSTLQSASSTLHESQRTRPLIHETGTHLSSVTYATTTPTSTIQLTTTTTELPTTIHKQPIEELSTVLKNNGLHAMAKYLRQSGLDTILNETGPYTVFAPSDKAFKNLLVQLGGPERAEDKFKANPRLLSGLLLHHVIPGSFEIASLQDEMTGVSLAGTQLRVNQYNMHDAEWNDVKVTTINGAMISTEKKDIPIPQGIAHSVDRVMFPLPVGDLLQTLQADRERRFTNFLRALFSSGIADILQSKEANSGKTYTIFAPIDSSFKNMTKDELNEIITDKDESQKFVMRYITPGTLFSSGIRFYQVKDSLAAGKSITLQKSNEGQIKINESHIATSNVPATNGVIHAIDSLI